MIRKVKTKSSSPGKASVKSSKIDKANVMDIFSGGDEDSTENSKAFDNPQESRGRDSSADANIPETPLPEPGDPSRSGATYESPNFSLNTNKLKEKPNSQITNRESPLSDKAYRPLQKTATREDAVPSLNNPGMSKPVLDKYPQANQIATDNAAFPKDFRSEMNPVSSDFTAKSLDQREPMKNALYTEVNQVKFESFDNAKNKLKEKSDSEINRLTNPEVQADYFTSSAKEGLPSNFFAKGDLAPSNVFSEYNNTTGDYGKGNMPQTNEASSMMTQKSVEAANISSPQRGADALTNTEGKGSFKGDKISKPEANVNTGIKDTVTNSLSSKDSMSTEKSNNLSLGQMGRSFFVSNFSSVSPGITGAIDNSSSNTSNAESQISSST
jgi:hypothetical protein